MEDEALLSRRLSTESVAEFVEDDRRYKTKLFNKFLAQYDGSVDSDDVHMAKSRAPEVISTFVKEHGVVMGTVARSGLSGMFMGNTAEKILDRIECSVLALKPYNFKSSIRLD